MITAFGDIETAVQAMKQGAYDFVTKPINLDQLLIIIKKALESRRLSREVLQLKRQMEIGEGFEYILGESKAMKKVYDMAQQVAKSDTTTVLIEGESGVGKEMIARLIHKFSNRADKPFLDINCASLPEQLLESELFGHEKGAFTDAKVQKQGLLELANRGTLFLDEIGEMSLTIQVKLLRVLERMVFRRVGGTADIHVSVRIISATNRDLKKEVDESRFRPDLYYRLKVVPVYVPALRERKEDLLELRQVLHQQLQQAVQQELRSDQRRRAEGDVRLPVAGKHPRAEEQRRAHRSARAGAGAQGGTPAVLGCAARGGAA